MNNDNSTIQSLRVISQAGLAMWGMSELAFVKRVVVNESVGWSIHAADGTPMGMAPTRDIAFAAIKQHELEPVSVH